MAQKSFKTIVVHDDLYDELRRLGTVTESFNDVIWKLINKAASGQSSFQGPADQKTAAPSELGGQNG
jgi:hypothetical protein